jgi:hypothetical protein
VFSLTLSRLFTFAFDVDLCILALAIFGMNVNKAGLILELKMMILTDWIGLDGLVGCNFSDYAHGFLIMVIDLVNFEKKNFCEWKLVLTLE